MIYGFYGYSSDWKLDIVKQKMLNWLGNNGKMPWHTNFKITFSKRFLDLVRTFLFQFGVIWEVWLPLLIIWLKIGHCKAKNVKFPGNDGKKTWQSNFKIRFSRRSLDLVRVFLFHFGLLWEVWLPVVIL